MHKHVYSYGTHWNIRSSRIAEMDSLEFDIALHLLKLLTAILLIVDFGFLLDDGEDLGGRSPGVGKHLQGGERMPQGHRANHHPKENLSKKKNISLYTVVPRHKIRPKCMILSHYRR